MRTFNYSQEIQNLLTPEIVQLLTCIHEHKGRQDLFLEANTDELKALVDVAMIQSTGASNRIEGIFTSDKRLEALVSKKAEPHNRSQRCLYLILSNDSRDFEHPCVQKQIGNCKRHNYPFMRKNIKKEIPRCIAKCKLHTLKESFLSFNLI